ncbi:YdcF family protein [Ochrobactrum sp. SFR4]|uniref:YdcF family protein n=1 Tax=Ochrobactrum sp. SFR4 TaxID=2717368 RepID=UPI001C8CA47B|nr:YdcF family protein [Ochrobactrum sp. SFR4]MBX8825546.1 YdcF family protein [Ochrobactrum sp. SFR4]
MAMHVQNNASDTAEQNRQNGERPAATTGREASVHVSKDGFTRHWLKRLRRRIPPVAVVLFSLIVALGIGFVIFSEHVSNLQAPPADQKADAIIVLTGGKSRIEVALELLAEKRGERLLISGVHPSTKREALQRVTRTDPALFSCCVDLDRSALNTIGNAVESAKWIKQHNYKRIFIVTNNYHIPRSILELSRQVSNVELLPYPVINSDLKNNNWMRQGDTLRVLFTEYIKYIGALAHISLSQND